MGEHRALGQAGGAAGVLQERNVVRGKRHRLQLRARSARERRAQAEGAVDAPVGHHLLHLLHHEIDDPALGHGQHVAELGGDHMLHLGFRDHLLQGVGEVFDDHDGLGAGVLQLVLELARRVQRIDVDHRHASAQDADQRDRILHQIRAHDGNALALGHSGQALQERGKVATVPVEFGVSHAAIEVAVRRQVGEFGQDLLHQIRNRTVFVCVDFGRNARRIFLQPYFFAHGIAPPRLLELTSVLAGEGRLPALAAGDCKRLAGTAYLHSRSMRIFISFCLRWY